MQKMSRFLAVLVLAAGSSLTARAAELPDPVLPAGVGVNIHFTRGHERDLDLIAAAGFKCIRMDFAWGRIERTKGDYDWSDYDELTAHLDRHGLRAYYILDYSNPLYEEQTVTPDAVFVNRSQRSPASPQHPESRAAFARWAAAAAAHFQGRQVIWEIWNEPNGGFWKPRPDADQYTALALATAKAVRAADPQATIVGPASSGLPWPFLETFLRSGMLEYVDGVSVHPYRQPNRPPETAAADFKRLRGLIESNAPAGSRRFIPILSGEWGYSSTIGGVSPDAQADFIVRQQLFNRLNGVPLSIWYDWKNDGTDPRENEHNFGTVTPDLQPKPAYTAIKVMTHELAGYRIARRYPVASAHDYVLVLTNAAGETKLAAWTRDAPHAVVIPLPAGAAKEFPGVSRDGQNNPVKANAAGLTLPLSGSPQYVELGRMSLN